jgi:UMF1 family MFS transporter
VLSGPRIVFLWTAAWMMFFSLPLIFRIPPDRRGVSNVSWRAGWTRIGQTLRRYKQQRPVFVFLIARMCFADGLNTVFVFGGLFAAGVFGFSEKEMMTFAVALNAAAAAGAALSSRWDDRCGSRALILVSLLALMAGLSAILLARTRAQFWTAGLFLGLWVGPLQASARAYLAKSVPVDQANEWFGFYGFSGRVTAFLGPLLVGTVTALSGSQRIGLTAVLVFFAAGYGLMLRVPEPLRDRA